jgi:hypothetical protein
MASSIVFKFVLTVALFLISFMASFSSWSQSYDFGIYNVSVVVG